jgi:glycosyltransferase involved in cell wall biosynthesis
MLYELAAQAESTLGPGGDGGMGGARKRVVLFSKLAFYPTHWEAFKFICVHYRVEGTIIAQPPPEVPAVHRVAWVTPERREHDAFRPPIFEMPTGSLLAQARWLHKTLHALQPDIIWWQGEPTDAGLLMACALYWGKRRVRIVSALAENIFRRKQWWLEAARRCLWHRLDAVIAMASPSIDGIRAAGMPQSVPAHPLVAGILEPPATVVPMDLPFARAAGDFIIGFAGRICPEKGWQVLLEAVRTLPSTFKCVLAGIGPQVDELQTWMNLPGLHGRVSYVGLLNRDALWRFYAAMDCLVVPSLTTPTWKEQFGAVLADGMALGVPLIGSDSGGIPEAIGPAGIVVPEGDVSAIAAALLRLMGDPALRRELAEQGRQRFTAEFAVPAYARKIAQALLLQ